IATPPLWRTARIVVARNRDTVWPSAVEPSSLSTRRQGAVCILRDSRQPNSRTFPNRLFTRIIGIAIRSGLRSRLAGPLTQEQTRMFRIKRWIPSALALACLLAVGGVVAAWPIVAEVKDDAGFFSAETIKKANAEIKAIKDQAKKDLVIETFKELPADKKEAYEKVSKDPKERERFFVEWARARAKSLEVNGIYVGIFKSPSHLEVEVGHETQKKAFTLENRRKLRDIL